MPTGRANSISPGVETASRQPARGRPREFCVDDALAAALQVFWRKGFEGASLSELTGAMGISRPSLYACFGNKEALFRRALDLYETEKMAHMREALAEPTARAVAEHLLYGTLERQTSVCDPRGCLVIASMQCGDQAAAIRDEILKRGAAANDALIARFARAKEEGDLGGDADPEGLARLLYAVSNGLAIQAQNGATPEQLAALVQTALQCWPKGN